VPRDAVDAVGLLDEAYFMYGEEVEWLHRMRASGRHVAWEPRAVAVHLGGGSARSEWGSLYQRQLANHVRAVALMEGEQVARRTQRVIVVALHMRAVLWRVASLLPLPGRALRRGRAAASADGVRTVRSIDPAAMEAPVIPRWRVQREPDATR
jgi:GT2 family glycosyltransferase